MCVRVSVCMAHLSSPLSLTSSPEPVYLSPLGLQENREACQVQLHRKTSGRGHHFRVQSQKFL